MERRRLAVVPDADDRRIGWQLLVGDHRLLGLGRHSHLVGTGRDAGVGRPPPARVEHTIERADREIDRRPRGGRQHCIVAAVDPLDADASRRSRRELIESGLGVGVLWWPGPLRLHVPGVVTGEQQPAEARVAAVPRRRPPHDSLVLGAGEGDVGEAEVLAALLDKLLRARRRTLVAADVDCSAIGCGRIVEHRGRVLVDPGRVPEERAVDHGKLESLAAVKGEHLHRFGVGLESPASVIEPASLFRVVDGLVEPLGQRGDADLLGGHHGVE